MRVFSSHAVTRTRGVTYVKAADWSTYRGQYHSMPGSCRGARPLCLFSLASPARSTDFICCNVLGSAWTVGRKRANLGSYMQWRYLLRVLITFERALLTGFARTRSRTIQHGSTNAPDHWHAANSLATNTRRFITALWAVVIKIGQAVPVESRAVVALKFLW